MKKFAFIAMLLLSISHVFARNGSEAASLETVQEIILTEVYNIMPLDNPKEKGQGEGFDPTQFRAFLNGNLLSASAYTNAPAYVEVINMDGDNIIVTNPNDDSTNESEWDNWISFLGCHVVNSTALISQIDECLQEQLIIQ